MFIVITFVLIYFVEFFKICF